MASWAVSLWWRLGGVLAVAVLFQVIAGQGEIATGESQDSNARHVPVVAHTLRPARPTPEPSRLTRMAGEIADDAGFAAPPVWLVATISITAVVPADNALDVAVSTNVTVSFSAEVNPATVTPSTFRLLDPGSNPVPSQVSVGPLSLRATLDPVGALAFGQLYTVEVTEGVEAATGGTASPFSSQFATVAAPPPEQLPETSEEATPPAGAAQAVTGASVSAAGDLNGDGIADFVAGAPGLVVGGAVEAGAALVYFGSASSQERAEPDIIFEGISTHDRTGVSVSGNFDFNGDNIPDILIGADQVNRTGVDDPVAGCAAGAPCGSGRVYLIYFDPSDSTHYPNIGDPALPDVVDLSLVGSAIPGVVFTGAFGDQVGFSVAGGGQISSGVGSDVAIGAPGADPGSPPRTDAGVAYLIFNDPSLSGTIDLSRVANGQADQVDGIVYLGAAPGDHFGFSCSFPGDVTGSAGDDFAVGAPGHDALLPAKGAAADAESTDSGAVVVPEGGTLIGIIESSDVGDTKPGSVVEGDQDGMELGSAVAGGVDNLVDGETDLLMGAPLYDATDPFGQTLVDAGLVAQTASKLPDGTILVSSIGADPALDPNAVNGVRYTGEAAGDGLGSAVTGLGDVTGDGFDDVAFGAPFYDALVDGMPVTDAGAVYRVDGYVPSDMSQGTVDVSAIGDTVAGSQQTGVEQGENAGSSLSEGGDLDGDGDTDYLVGAPDKDSTQPDDNAGTVYMVLESEPVLPGSCGPAGCVVADLQNGAQIAVPAGSLSETVGLAVGGMLDPAGLPIAPPGDTSFLGAADYDPEGQNFGAPLPTIHIPIRPELGGQFAGGEVLDLWYFSGGAWVDSGVDGMVEANPHYPTLLAVRASVDVLHFYAVFIVDVDGDEFWDAIDSNSADPFVCADTDADSCDDCSSGSYAPANDGTDVDADGICDASDDCLDVDGDGVGDGTLGNAGCATTATTDSNDADPLVCADDDADSCEDCSSGVYDPSADGADTDSDGQCDASDGDDDNDGVIDGVDTDPLDPSVCADADSDGCDDCAVGIDGFGPSPDNDPNDDGPDADTDGICDASDDCTDADGDGVGNGNLGNTGCVTATTDSNDADTTACADEDGDTCDDCSSGTYAPASDGTDTDTDGLCDPGDPDDDNDSVVDGLDCAPLDAQHWALPGEAGGLTLVHHDIGGTTTLSWTAPTQTGTSLLLAYDTLSSDDPSDFMLTATCLDSDGTDLASTDARPLPPGAVLFFLVRAQNACGHGPLGLDSFGQPRTAIGCP